MKIMYFTEMLPFKSTSYGTFVVNRLTQLKKDKEYEIFVCRLNNVLYSKKIINSYQIRSQIDRIKVDTVNYFKIKEYGNFDIVAKRLRVYYFKNNCNLMHIHYAFPEGYLGYLVKIKYGIDYVLTVHGTDMHSIPFKSKKYSERVVKALCEAYHVIFVSEKLQKIAESIGYVKSNYSIIPGGIDLELFVKRKPLNFDENVVVGYIGNLNHVKGSDRLPDIIKETVERRRDILFEIIGDGGYRKFIEKAVKKNKLQKSVKMYGNVDNSELPEIMNKWKVLILPSRKEGMPTVLAEAFAMGIPVISSKIDGFEKYIIEGKTGYLIEQNENYSKKFTESLVKIIDFGVDEESVKQKSIEFDIKNTVKEEKKIYEQYKNGK